MRMNAEAFSKMKPSAIFLNLGRGPIVVERDLADALENKTIAGAGLDVLTVEPMSAENPLKRIKDSDRLIITPHIAWASLEARTRLMKIIEGQIRDFFGGSDKETLEGTLCKQPISLLSEAIYKNKIQK